MKHRLQLEPIIAIGIVLVIGSLTMLLAGVSPIDGFSALLFGAFGGRSEIGETLVQTTALLFPALGICLAFRSGLFNIGAEGQLIMGGLFAGALGANFNAPPIIAISAMLVAGMLGGGIWGAIAGWMKARFGASEVIATLMLNFVAGFVALALVNGPWKSPLASGAETAPLLPAAFLPSLLSGTRLSIAPLLAIGLAVVIYVVLQKTVFGFDLRAMGDAPEAARRSGVNIARLSVIALGLSGACAGLGGATIVGGMLHRFNTALSPGYGFTAIAVALVGELNPFWICIAALGFGALESGGLAMQASAQVPKDAIHVIEGAIILVLAARRYIVTRRTAAV